MKQHPLHKIHGLDPFEFPSDRHLGLSTIIALRTIAAAMEKPYTNVAIIDHYPTREADQYLSTIIERIVDGAGFREFYIKKIGNNLYLRFGEFD